MEPSFTFGQESFNQEKLQLIQLLLNTESPSVIKKVKELLIKSQPSLLTQQEIIDRANESEIAYKKGKVLSLDDLEEETKSW